MSLQVPPVDVEPVKVWSDSGLNMTSIKSGCVQGASLLLAASIINDIYNRAVAKGMVHISCLVVTRWLHDAIWVQDLEELVPHLSASAQRHSEEVDRLAEENEKLTQQIGIFNKLNDDYQRLNHESKEEFVERIKELEALRDRTAAQAAAAQAQRDATLKALREVQEGLSSEVNRLGSNLDKREPKEIARILDGALLERLPDNQQAKDLCKQLITVLSLED